MATKSSPKPRKSANRSQARVNARIDPRTEKKLRYLRHRTRLSPTDIVKKSVGLLYEKVKRRQKNPAIVLASCGLIGCFEDRSDLSTTYQPILTEAIDKKV